MASDVIILVLLALFPLRNHFQTQRGLAAVPEMKNLAVLPFYTAGNDPQTMAFGDGLVGNLTAQLTQLTERRSLQVVPASEVRSQHLATAEQARQSFGANLVLEGNIERSGKLVRVNYTLVDTSTRRALRADTITAPTSDTFAVEGQVAASVLRNLDIVLQPNEKQAFKTYGTSQPAAYDYYLQGRGYLEAFQKPEDVERAIQVFNNALKLDSNYGLALAGLGEAYWRKYELPGCLTPLRAAQCACKGSHAYPKVCRIYLQTGITPTTPDRACVAPGGTVVWIQKSSVHDDWHVRFDKPGVRSPFQEGMEFVKGRETGHVLPSAKGDYPHSVIVNGKTFDPHIIIGYAH